jgi:esterase/lipase
MFEGGDRHPVIVIPGFMTDDWSTIPMRKFINELGYESKGWELGSNHPGDEIERYVGNICKLVQSERKRTGEKVTIIGWSLGGTLARCVARKIPNSVRQVITLGSPLSDVHLVGPPILRSLYKRKAKRPLEELVEIIGNLTEFNGVPTTSVYSKTDGIVDWQHSLLDVHEYHQNIEIDASHVGLGTHLAVSVILAEKLTHHIDNWKPIKDDNWRNVLLENS